jgi:hypothetical protein
MKMLGAGQNPRNACIPEWFLGRLLGSLGGTGLGAGVPARSPPFLALFSSSMKGED